MDVLNNNNPWIAEERSLRVCARRDDKTARVPLDVARIVDALWRQRYTLLA